MKDQVELTLGNSECLLTGLSLAQFKELRTILSYSDSPQSHYFSGSYKANRRYLLDKKGRFPSGLLYLVEAWATKTKVPVLIKDGRKVPPPASHREFECTLPFSPHLEQVEAAVSAVTAQRGIIAAPTGSGKSVIIALIINLLKLKTLIVVPSLELKKQLTESLRAFFGTLRNITVENIDALDPNTPSDADCLIIDEFHHSAAMTYRVLNKKAWKNIYFRFGLTATPFRSQDCERLLLESVLSQVVYRIEYKTAVEKKFIVPIEAYYIELPKTKLKGDPTSWPAVYSQLVVNNEHRNALIAQLLTNLTNQGISNLCLVKEVAHGHKLSQDTALGFATGVNDNNRQLILEFILGERVGLIGTTGVIGEGVDTKPAEFVVIAGLGKSKNAFMQQVGRVMRVVPGKETGKVILFKDASHKWTLAHFKAQCKILKEEYGITPAELKL